MATVWAFVSLSLVAAACGSSSGAASGGPQVDREQALLEFAQCMREEGVDIPDPTVDADGNVRIQRPRTRDGQPPSPEERERFRAAQEACADHLEGLTLGFTEEDRAAFQDTLLEFARCMRRNGYDMPDPNFQATPSPGQGGPGGGPFGSFDRGDPAFQEALQACRSVLTEAGFPGGPGGGLSGQGEGGNP